MYDRGTGGGPDVESRARAKPHWCRLRLDSDTPHPPVMDLKVHPLTGAVYAFTFGRGVFRLKNVGDAIEVCERSLGAMAASPASGNRTGGRVVQSTDSGHQPGQTSTTTASSVILTVLVAGSGHGTVMDRSPDSFRENCEKTALSGGRSCLFEYPPGAVVGLLATPSAGSAFQRWDCGGSDTADVCNVTMTRATTVTAIFTTHTLTVGAWGPGTVSAPATASSTAIDCRTTCISYNLADTVVTLKALATGESLFAGWDPPCGPALTPEGSKVGWCRVTVGKSSGVASGTTTMVTARFRGATVAVERLGERAGIVVGQGPIMVGRQATIRCDQANEPCRFLGPTTVTLTATPEDASDLVCWQGCPKAMRNICEVDVELKGVARVGVKFVSSQTPCQCGATCP